MQEKAIKNILSGRRLGTFFTENVADVQSTPVEILAENGTYARSPVVSRRADLRTFCRGPCRPSLGYPLTVVEWVSLMNLHQ